MGLGKGKAERPGEDPAFRRHLHGRDQDKHPTGFLCKTPGFEGSCLALAYAGLPLASSILQLLIGPGKDPGRPESWLCGGPRQAGVSIPYRLFPAAPQRDSSKTGFLLIQDFRDVQAALGEGPTAGKVDSPQRDNQAPRKVGFAVAANH